MAEEEERKRQEKQAKAEEAAKAEKQAVEDIERAAQEETEEGKTEEEAAAEGLKLVFPPLPIRIWVPPPEVPIEKLGTGTNTKVYFIKFF